MLLSEIKPNPDNHRLIKAERFKKLVKSLQDFPAMMELRPMVVDETFTVLGGNMRLQALSEMAVTPTPALEIKEKTSINAES